MHTVDALPNAVRQIDHYWIPLPDGTRLAARIWLPENTGPVPAILEYIPYRKGDGTAISDAPRYRYLAGHGYACLRVDLRGSGDSEGHCSDEYSAQEMADGVAVINWIAQQPWCSGRVGMTGISWGGFNALQIAALKPAPLCAIISACSTDDRYRNDVHYLGGAVLAHDQVPWAASFMSILARPPDPLVVGDAWQALWRDRLDQLPHLVEPWLEHQNNDAYWQHGSICHDYAAIECPVMLVGGWADAYTNPIFSMLSGLKDTTRALVGPWSHGWPDSIRPGPVIGYLRETLRWWDYWLKDIDTGVAGDAPLRFYQQHFQSPDTVSAHRDGEWRTVSYPLATDQSLTWTLSELEHSGSEVPNDLSHGIDGGVFCPFGPRSHFPQDQQHEDQRCLTFTSDPLAGDLALLGLPQLKVRLQSPAHGQLAVRLCEVNNEGQSLLISRGFVTLCGSSEVTIPLDALGHKVTAGNRLRIAIGRHYWPWLWPSASCDAVSLVAEHCHIALPAEQESTPLREPFDDAEQAQGLTFNVLKPPGGSRDIDNSDVITIEQHNNNGTLQMADGLQLSGSGSDRFTLARNDPLSACVVAKRSHQMVRGQWRVSTTLESVMTASKDEYHVRTALHAFAGDSLFFTREWHFSCPRAEDQA